MSSVMDFVKSAAAAGERGRERVWERVLPDKVEHAVKKVNNLHRKRQGTYGKNDMANTLWNEQPDVVAPTVEAPVQMPMPDDERMKLAKARSLAQQRSRGGRASTIFTSGDGLGG